MLETSRIDELRAYVDALPLDDRAILQLLAGLNGEKLVERKKMKAALGSSALIANRKIEQAFRRLRLAMGLAPEIEDEEILEALIVSETRIRAKSVLDSRKTESAPPKDAPPADEEFPWEDDAQKPAEAPAVPVTAASDTGQSPEAFAKLFKNGEGAEAAPKQPRQKRTPAPQTEEPA